MSKKKQSQPAEDPKELNAAFLLKFAKLNYEAKTINVQMLNAFSNLLHYLSDSLAKDPQNYSQEIIKTLIDIAITVEFNLHMTDDCLSAQIEPVLKFLQSLFNFIEKVFTHEHKPNKDKAIQVIDLFWPLLKNEKEIEKVQVKQFDKIASVLQKIPNLPYIFEIEPHNLKIDPELVLSEAIEISYLNEKIDFSVIFRAALSRYNQKNRIFIESFLTFFEYSMNETTNSKENRMLFEKCLNVLMNISNSIGEKYNYIQIFFNRIIKSSNLIRNFVYALSSRLNHGSSQSDIKIEKYYSNDHLLSLSFIILEKVVTFRYMTKDMSEALEIIAKFSENWTDLDENSFNTNDFGNKINPDFLFKIIKFLIIQNKAPQQEQISSLSKIFENTSLLENDKGLEGEMDEMKLYEFIRQCSKIRTQSQDGEDQIAQNMASNRVNSSKKDDSNKHVLQTCLVKSFSKILQNLSKNNQIAEKLKFKSVQCFEEVFIHCFEGEVQGQTQEAAVVKQVSQLIIRCFPLLIPDQWMDQLLRKFLFGQQQNSVVKSEKALEIIRVLLIKKMETQNFSKLKTDLNIEEFMNSTFGLTAINQENVLNFHFLIFYIYLKKCSSLSDKDEISEVRSIASLVIEKLTDLIENHSKLTQGKEPLTIQKFNKKLLILQFLLILILDHPSGSFKLSVKKIFSTDIFKVGKALDLYELISINQKQTASNFFNLRLRQILSDKTETSLTQKFLTFVQKLNTISFPKNYLHSASETKEEKHLKIFLNIKINGIALSINRTHKIPTLIQNINTMRKVNAIDELEILLFSFGQTVEEMQEAENIIKEEEKHHQNQFYSLGDSSIIVVFNYLLKISIESNKFNERSIEQVQTDIRQQIKTLKVIHISVQQTLEKIKQITLSQNPPFDIKTLIKLLTSMKDSSSQTGIVQKYSELINEGQIVRLISQLAEDPQKLKLEFTQLALTTMKKLLMKDQKIRERINELQKVKLEQKDEKMVVENEEAEIVEEEQELVAMTDLTPKLKQLFLMYFPLKHDLNLINLLKVRIQSAILQLFENPEQAASIQLSQRESLQKSIVEDLLKNISLLKEIIIKENEDLSAETRVSLLWNFEYQSDQKFMTFIIKSILKMFSSNLAAQSSFELNDKIFAISAELLENEQICKLAQKQIGQNLNLQLVSMISQRVNQGIMIVKKSSESISPRKSKKQIVHSQEQQHKQTKDFLSSSLKLYNVLKKVINFESVNSEQLVATLIQKDPLTCPEITKFLLQQLLNISSSFIKTKSQSITDTVFSYIMQVNESYTAGKQKLHIPEFICEFFDISHSENSANWMSLLEKSDRVTGVCTPNPAYRCMKCDDKRLICYSCMLQCHKGHPVLYLGDQKFPRCQCRETLDDCCKLVKKNEEPREGRKDLFGGNIFSRQGIRSSKHQFFMSGDQDRAYGQLEMEEEEEYNDMYRFGGGKIRKPREFDPLDRENIFSLDPSYERMERLDNPFERPPLLRQDKKTEESTNKAAEQNFDFEDEVYDSGKNQMEIEKPSSPQTEPSIVSQSYYLPVFLQMFNQIHSKNEEVSTQKINYQMEKVGFDSLVSGKVTHASWRATNAGSYNVRIRRDNPLNNKSAAVSKQIIAQNSKFLVIASGNMLFVHLKEKYLQQLLQMKPNQTFQSVHQFNGNFDIHTIDFSPLDDFTFVAAGLHMIVLMQVTGDGLISRNNTQHLRVSVNNDYINKVRASALGVFYSTSYEIKFMNWSFKQMLTIKSSAQCLLKEWCLYEKRNGCTVYCVTAQGYTEFIDVSPSDEGKKFFTHKVNDGRKKIETGANILIKDVEKVGKIYIGSFKDSEGTNMIANLVGDTTENPSFFTLKNNYVDIFGKKFLIGQAEVVKGGENEMYVICTIREPITPEISIHQGQLVVYKIRKDRKCEFNLINTENKCEHFCVVPIGGDNWSIISMHDDGSLHFTVLNKPQKQVIDQECKRLKQIQPVNNDQNKEKYSQMKESIKKMISFETLQSAELQPLNYFREFSDLMKNNTDVKIKKSNNEYEITLLNSTKLITGFTLPFLGNVHFPHRTVKSVVQVGLSNLQILYYFVEGSLKFRVQKVEDYKSGMESMNQKFKQKLQRLERLNEMAMDTERAAQIINSIKQAEMINDEVEFYGTTVDAFRNRIPNFGEIFNEESNTESKDKSIEKMSILLKIFIEHSIKEQNYLCEPYEILQFVKNLRKLSLTTTKPETYTILKSLIVSTLKMYENMSETHFHIFNDELYPLKYATEEKANLYYEMLKGEISDSQVEQIVNAFCQICQDDLPLGLLYLSKYPSLLAKIQKKAKKVQKVDQTVTKLLKLYVLGYQVLKYKNHNCDWILGAICSIFATQTKSKPLRQSFYDTLSKYANVKLDAWLKNVPEVDGQENVSDVNIINKPPAVRQQNLASQNNLSAIYGQFGMGEMDEEAMIRMAIEMSEMEFKQKQEDNFNFSGNNNAANLIEEEKQNFEDEVLMMEEGSSRQIVREEKKRTFLMDLVEHCTSKLSDPQELAIPKIIVLYVVSKYVNSTEDANVFTEILKRILKILGGQLNTNCDNFDKHILMAYFSVFSNILTTSNILKKKLSQEAEELCLVINEEVMERLQAVKPEKVSKLKSPPNLLGKIFRGDKLYTFAHYAYGLASLLLPPCEPSPVLLSLECYWLLPQSKEYYTKMKNMTTIKQGIATGNIDKIYEVATQYPEIWRECSDVTWLESWILDRKHNWERALTLLALYYDEKAEQGLNN